MRRLWVGAVVLVLFVLVGGSAAQAATGDDPQSTLRHSGTTLKARPADQVGMPLSGVEGEGVSAEGGMVAAAAANTLFSNGFEWASVPFAVYGPGWAVTQYRASEGAYSAYCAGMYAPPPGPYVKDMDSWLIAGPFDLGGFNSAELSFDVWADCESGQDFLSAGASADGYLFDVVEYSGTTAGAWVRETVDISAYCGSSEVWIAFAFDSNDVDQYEGAYIDAVALTGTRTPTALNPVFRFYNLQNGTHFYTPSEDERSRVINTLSNVYSYEGIAYSTSPYNNAQPLYRFYNRNAGGHFYTASIDEADAVRRKWSNVYQYEGQTYAVNPWPVPDSVPVFRFYNKRTGTHFYTASADERDVVMATWPHIFTYEGPAFWVGQKTTPPVTPVSPEAPGDPMPETLWQPSDAVLPETGNYIYLDSDPGDYIGGGKKYLYTPADTLISVTSSGGLLNVNVNGDEQWGGQFKAPDWLSELESGYFPRLSRYPFHDPYVGGLNWSGEGRGSNTLAGWCFIDSATYTDGVLTAIDLRFEQHSGGSAPALRGKIHWRADDATVPPGPVNPIPEALWQPTGASLPETGNYVYLDSDPGDYVGAGREYLYTPDNATISVGAIGGRLGIGITGVDRWNGTFQAMNSIGTLQTGYYPDLQRYPFHNPSKGGMDWSGNGRGSNTLTGWFVVDSVTYSDGVLTAIDMRFEQHSGGGTPALHGVVHWRAEG